MANNNLITRLKADTSQFDRKVQGAKSTLEQFGMKGKEAGQMIGQLDKVLGTNIGTLGKLSVATAAASTALKVMKDAFFSSEQNIDEWGRVTESAKSAYQTFLNALNSGNWEGFFSRLNDAIGGARELYDMFDRLGSTKLNNSVPIAILENKLAELRLLKQQGKDVGDQIKNVSAQLGKLKGEEVTAGKSANRQGWVDVIKNAGGDETYAKVFFDRYKKEGQSFYDWAAKEQKKYEGLVKGDVTNHYQSYRKENTLTGEARKRYQTLKAITAKETSLQEYQTGYAQAIQQEGAINAQQFKYNRWGQNLKNGGSGGSSKGGGGSTIAQLSATDAGLSDLALIPDSSIKAMKEKLAEAQALYEEAGDEGGRKYAQALIEAYSNEIEYLKGNDPFTETIAKDFEESMKNVKLPKFPVAQALEDADAASKKTQKNVQGAATAFTALGDALTSIEDPGAKTAGLIMQAIGSVVAGYGAATAQAATMGPWAWIAFAATGLATMISTIASIKQVTAGAYADGGVVGGNSYYGDKLYARVNSGETILNQDQARRALDMMQPAYSGGGTSSISGEQIVTVINAYGRRTGRGEILR